MPWSWRVMSVPDGTGPQCEGSSGERRASPTHRSKRERGSGGRQGWGRRNPLTPASEHAPVPAAGSPHSPCPRQPSESRKHSGVPCPGPCDWRQLPGLPWRLPLHGGAAAGRALPPRSPLRPAPPPPKAEKGAHVWPLPSWGCGGASRQVNVCSLLPWQKGMSPPP